jgi:hypothetical protein
LASERPELANSHSDHLADETAKVHSPAKAHFIMAVEQLKNLIGAIRKDPSRAPDGQYDQVTEGKTSVMADMYNLDFKDKRMLAEVC